MWNDLTKYARGRTQKGTSVGKANGLLAKGKATDSRRPQKGVDLFWSELPWNFVSLYDTLVPFAQNY